VSGSATVRALKGRSNLEALSSDLTKEQFVPLYAAVTRESSTLNKFAFLVGIVNGKIQ
jgi:hypothetical protein